MQPRSRRIKLLACVSCWLFPAPAGGAEAERDGDLRMRIALVIERFEPGGGMEGAAWQVARGLARAGDEVHVIARRATPAPGVEAHLVRAPSRWMPLRVAVFAKQAARAAAAGRFDVVHAFSRVPKQHLYRAGGGSHADYMKCAYGPVGAGLRRLTPRHALLLGLERRIFASGS